MTAASDSYNAILITGFAGLLLPVWFQRVALLLVHSPERLEVDPLEPVLVLLVRAGLLQPLVDHHGHGDGVKLFLDYLVNCSYGY